MFPLEAWVYIAKERQDEIERRLKRNQLLRDATSARKDPPQSFLIRAILRYTHSILKSTLPMPTTRNHRLTTTKDSSLLNMSTLVGKFKPDVGTSHLNGGHQES